MLYVKKKKKMTTKDGVSHGHCCDKCTIINARNTVSRHVSVIQML